MNPEESLQNLKRIAAVFVGSIAIIGLVLNPAHVAITPEGSILIMMLAGFMIFWGI